MSNEPVYVRDYLVKKYEEFIRNIKSDLDLSYNRCFTYYMADSMNSMIGLTGNDIYACDIVRAGPSALVYLFGLDDPIVSEILKTEDKVERSKRISLILKNGYRGIDIRDINSIFKIIIVMYVYSNFRDVKILEFAKDGMIITGIPEDCESVIPDIFKIRVEKIDKYLRYNKTTVIINSGRDIVIKGFYRDPPEGILDVFRKYPMVDLMELKKLYSSEYLKALITFDDKERIDYLYKFGSGKYLGRTGYVDDYRKILPSKYLVDIVYPYINL